MGILARFHAFSFHLPGVACIGVYRSDSLPSHPARRQKRPFPSTTEATPLVEPDELADDRLHLVPVTLHRCCFANPCGDSLARAGQILRIREQDCTDTAPRLGEWRPPVPTSSSTASLRILNARPFACLFAPSRHAGVDSPSQASAPSRIAGDYAHTPAHMAGILREVWTALRPSTGIPGGSLS